jgi:enoyl-CoA hydratase/carnithine racemase
VRRPGGAGATLGGESHAGAAISGVHEAGSTVIAERVGPVVTLVLDEPARRNPLSLATIEALHAGLRAAGDDPGVRAVVVGASGPVFSAGHDLRELAVDDPEAHARVFAACAQMMLAIHRLPVPVIARVQGLATAAGCQLVAACDMAVAAEGARFATPGVRIGLFCTTPMVEVARAVGRARAASMLYTGEPIDAATALAWGLVTRVVPAEDLDAEAAALAARVAGSSRTALAIGKRALAENLDLPLEQAYEHASRVMCVNAATPDAQEGIEAFLGKREPVWTHGAPPE